MISHHHRRRGFTLIEMLVSLAIGSILLLASVAMLDNTGAAYERIGGGVAAERDARGLLSQLAADLANARFNKDGVLEKSSATWPTDKLGFLCLQPAQAQADSGHIGDLCAVSYAIRDLSVNGRTVRCLVRGCNESSDTFKALQNNDLHSLLTRHSDSDEPVAFGVVSFTARPKSRDSAGQWIDWPAGDSTGPEALDVCLVLARRNLITKLQRPADWDGAGAAARLLGLPSAARRNPRLDVYSTLIRFGNHDHPPATKP